MRTTLFVLSSLFLVLTALMSLNIARFNFRDVENAPRLSERLGSMKVTSATAAKRDELKEELDSLTGDLQRGAAAALATGLVALFTLGGLYMRKWLSYSVPALIVVGLLAIPLNPYFERHAPAPPRTLALVLAGLAVAGAVAAFSADRTRRSATA